MDQTSLEGPEDLEVLVITSQKGKGMLFPKVLVNEIHLPNGIYFDLSTFLFTPFCAIRLTNQQGGWELDESKKEAALRETIEEAGVRGTVEVRLFDKMTEV